MDLREQRRVSMPSCFVCRHAGKHIIIWPQHMTAGPTTDGSGTYTSGNWSCYVKVEETGIIAANNTILRSGRKQLEICWDHHKDLYENWVAVAQLEVDLENQWHAFMERVEDGRDLFYR